MSSTSFSCSDVVSCASARARPHTDLGCQRRVGVLGGTARNVGTACGRNPIPIIIPCHRVVGANGTMVGYSGGAGVESKVALLALEGVLLPL